MGGLYCPPLIPAGIRRNPGNSRNSGGIKFGRGACQIDSMIPPEWFLEFPGRNQFPEFNGTESGPFTTTHTMPSHAQIDRRCLLTINLGVVNNPQPYSLTTTTIHNALPPSPPRHRHQRPPPLPIVTCRTQRPQHAPTSQEEDATSPLKNDATPPRYRMNEPPPGATSPTATWQPDAERRHQSSFVIDIRGEC